MMPIKSTSGTVPYYHRPIKFLVKIKNKNPEKLLEDIRTAFERTFGKRIYISEYCHAVRSLEIFYKINNSLIKLCTVMVSSSIIISEEATDLIEIRYPTNEKSPSQNNLQKSTRYQWFIPIEVEEFHFLITIKHSSLGLDFPAA